MNNKITYTINSRLACDTPLSNEIPLQDDLFIVLDDLDNRLKNQTINKDIDNNADKLYEILNQIIVNFGGEDFLHDLAEISVSIRPSDIKAFVNHATFLQHPFLKDMKTRYVIDWGDNSRRQIVDISSVFPVHQYETSGNYVIRINNQMQDNNIVDLSRSSLLKGIKASGTQTIVKGKNVVQHHLQKSYMIDDIYAIKNVRSINNIKISENIIEIADNFLSNAVTMNGMYFGENSQLTSIGKHVAENAHCLDSLVLPDNVSQIDESAFYGLTSLKRLVVPNTIKHIGKNAFALLNNSGLTVSVKNVVDDQQNSIALIQFFMHRIKDNTTDEFVSPTSTQMLKQSNHQHEYVMYIQHDKDIKVYLSDMKKTPDTRVSKYKMEINFSAVKDFMSIPGESITNNFLTRPVAIAFLKRLCKDIQITQIEKNIALPTEAPNWVWFKGSGNVDYADAMQCFNDSIIYIKKYGFTPEEIHNKCESIRSEVISLIDNSTMTKEAKEKAIKNIEDVWKSMDELYNDDPEEFAKRIKRKFPDDISDVFKLVQIDEEVHYSYELGAEVKITPCEHYKCTYCQDIKYVELEDVHNYISECIVDNVDDVHISSDEEAEQILIEKLNEHINKYKKTDCHIYD